MEAVPLIDEALVSVVVRRLGERDVRLPGFLAELRCTPLEQLCEAIGLLAFRRAWEGLTVGLADLVANQVFDVGVSPAKLRDPPGDVCCGILGGKGSGYLVTHVNNEARYIVNHVNF